MFGGVGFLSNGNMCVGVHKDGLIVRVAPGLPSAREYPRNGGRGPADETRRPQGAAKQSRR